MQFFSFALCRPPNISHQYEAIIRICFLDELFHFQIVAIPYKDNNKVSFVVVLPKSKTPSSLTLLLKELERAPDLLKNAMKEMKSQSLTLSIPKFKIETKFDLSAQYRNVSLM